MAIDSSKLAELLKKRMSGVKTEEKPEKKTEEKRTEPKVEEQPGIKLKLQPKIPPITMPRQEETVKKEIKPPEPIQPQKEEKPQEKPLLIPKPEAKPIEPVKEEKKATVEQPKIEKPIEKPKTEEIKPKPLKIESKPPKKEVSISIEEAKPKKIEAKIIKPKPKVAEYEYKPPREMLEEVEKFIERFINNPEEFEESIAKIVITIFGEKGLGKTFNALSLPGKILAFSFDKKTKPIKKFYYDDSPRITIIDTSKFIGSWDKPEITYQCEMFYQFIVRLLEKMKELPEEQRPDWILFDNMEELEAILEMAIRYRYGLPYKALIPIQLWKERKVMIKTLHRLALNVARMGVVYTTYVQYRTRWDAETGQFITERESPKWVSAIKTETDIVLKADYDELTKRWIVRVLSSKIPIIESGKVYDVSDNPIGNQISWDAWRELITRAKEYKERHG